MRPFAGEVVEFLGGDDDGVALFGFVVVVVVVVRFLGKW